MYCGRVDAATDGADAVGCEVGAIVGMGAWVEASVAGEAILAEAEVGAEQEADRRINAAQNERFRRVMYRFTNHIVSENL